ncbi:cytochrome c biogenesis CcdA family protein [Granulicatella balaenopterae]
MNHLELGALFLEGVLSFFSPCVLPVLPIYVGILAGNSTKDQNGELIYNRKTVFSNTIAFVIGISLTFFVLAFASSALSRLFMQHMTFLQVFSGVLIIIMGLLQLDIIQSNLLAREFSATNKIYSTEKQMTPFLALLMGFTFSFSWSPCIGPILASVFFYASTHHGIYSLILIIIYCIGFILPFILIAFFSQKVMAVFNRQVKFLRYTKIASGVLLILIGISILSGSFSSIIKLITI